MLRRFLLLVPGPAVIALALGACVGQPSALERLSTTPTQEYRGHYTVGAGGSWFRPCGAAAADSAWWVTVTDAAVAQVDGARQDGRLVEERPSFVHWRAVMTRGGEVGPRGPGAPALLVREVLAVRPAAAGDCNAP